MSQVSVVILTHNRKPELLACVERALALPEHPPVIVVDNASTDGTVMALAERFAPVTVVGAPFNMGAAARNLGVECCATPYVAFSDDDTAWEPGSLRIAAEVLDTNPHIAVLAARVLVGAEDREDPMSSLMARSPLPARTLPGPALLGFLAGAAVVRRSSFLEAGGYEPHFFIGGEEELLAYDLAAAGWHLVYLDSITVHHYPSLSRDVGHRARLLDRNALWVAWLRRPLGTALRISLKRLARKGGAAATVDALREWAWVLHNRRVVPASVEHGLRLLERQELLARRAVAPSDTAQYDRAD
jgi:GT2 family glycosyltransferase